MVAQPSEFCALCAITLLMTGDVTYRCHYRPPGYTASDKTPAGHHAAGYNPLTLAEQAVFSPPHTPLSYPIHYGFACEDVMGSVESHGKDKPNTPTALPSLLSLSASHSRLAGWSSVINLWWMLLIAFFTFMCLETASRFVCSTTFPRTKVRQTSL